ncbi:hypothetical protein CK203_115116 [Vitis vinifera]|uniref:Uncharacterized protein n=1 Tax=Vitis vinifera TaxID=29760 RepID=A0A438CAV7_VITVI|nr:hypothetical protein CK203_115116 [Vitis vinifera]
MGNSESAFDDPHHDFLHQTPSYAGTSMDPDYRHRRQLPYIADNFNSLDQVSSLTFYLLVGVHVCPHALGYIWRHGAIHMPCAGLLPSGDLRVH